MKARPVSMNSRFSKNIDWNVLEKKWTSKWRSEKIFQANIDTKRKKYFVTVAYPYPNSPQHIGHGRTYTLADVHARYMRMKGYNVLFPMGFHYTGTPILAMSRRIVSQDKELIDTFRSLYNISDSVIQNFNDPVNIARYFHAEIKKGMEEVGYSIDWRSEFTTIDKLYSKFISWQFRVLKSKGLIVQGSHPVGWCPNDQNPVSQHDTIGDVEPEFSEYSLIKFRLKLDNDAYCYLPAATLRPETIYGVTNLWLNPGIDYLLISLDDPSENWIVTVDAARKLEFLNHKITIRTTLSGKELIGKFVENPVTNKQLPIYPASFIKSDSGTGVVMSVPGHAPYDYQALDDLKNNHFTLDNYHLGSIVKPIYIISSETQNTGLLPVQEIIKKYQIMNQSDRNLEIATNELYSQEFYKGKMMPNTGRYEGMSVPEAKDMIKNELVMSGIADSMIELTNRPVKCRCGTECVVKILDDQWFINYGDHKWKTLAHDCVNEMDILPDEIRQEFNHVIDWLKERACARKSGLGTKLPWDTNWIIESLSDSVIYMAYYIIAKFSSSYKGVEILNHEQVNDSFFDYVLLGKGKSDIVARDCSLPIDFVEDLRTEFCYFYPVDARHSGRDLVANHLSFFVFNHVAIFERAKWPKQIVVNGSVLMQGKKMSKSIGNIVPLRSAIREHSADAIRIGMLISAELLQDADFSFDTLEGIKSKLTDLYHMTVDSSRSNKELVIKNRESNTVEDRWLDSRLQRAISEITVCIEKLRVREALHVLLYTLDQDLQWYRKRANAKDRDNNSTLPYIIRFLETRIKMLSPFAPFISEEIWEKLGNSNSVIFGGWPVVDNSKVDQIAEESEHLISNLISDVQAIIKVTKIEPSSIRIYVASSWKRSIYNKILGNIVLGRKTNFGDIMKQLIDDSSTVKAKTDPTFVKKTIDDILSETMEVRKRRISLKNFDEIPIIKDGQSLMKSDIGKTNVEILVFSEDDLDLQQHDPKSKAKSARPYKPAIYLQG
ncbi:MAG TPA: leucine--tRNA ligase [Nitrososphaeraceae archaeon]